MRSIGYYHYDASFATLLLRQAMAVHGKAKTARTAITGHFAQLGHPAVPLLPRRVDTWMALLEDILQCPSVQGLRDTAVAECVRHQEFLHLSMDATLRVAMRVKGQANYRASKHDRAQCVVDDTEAKRRILTLRGRTGAVIAMEPIQSEGAEVVEPVLTALLPKAVREQVLYIATDNPKPVQFSSLNKAFPKLRILYLDPVHLPIVYQTAFWGKVTAGQRYVRTIQAKFNKVDYNMPVSHWGSPYTGETPAVLSDAEESNRKLIISGAMSQPRATKILNELDGDKPWYRKADYIQALAAVSALFPHEMSRKTYMQSRPMRNVLWNSATADKVAWYWNSIIVRRSMPMHMVSLLGSGTSSNESLHHEMNTWWRNQPEVFPSTLALQMRVGSLGKILTHNAAMYSPPLRQYTQTEHFAMLLAQLNIFDDVSWRTWCGECTELPLREHRLSLQARLRAQTTPKVKTKPHLKLVKRPATSKVKKGSASATILKRPSGRYEVEVVQRAAAEGAAAEGAAAARLKRHCFNRKRVWV